MFVLCEFLFFEPFGEVLMANSFELDFVVGHLSFECLTQTNTLPKYMQ